MGWGVAMITTVTLNAAIDKTYYVERFEVGKVLRVPKELATPGGKGINVARVLSQLGADVTATGFVAGKNGEFIAEQLDQQGIGHDFVSVSGESRLCLNIIDQTTGTSTELLEPGPVVDSEGLSRIKAKVEQLAAISSTIVFSGSLPAGLPEDTYATLIRIAKQAGAKVLLDASKGPLLKGIEAAPAFIKPNEDEVKALMAEDEAYHSGAMPQTEAFFNRMFELNEQGIQFVIVTFGAKGAIAAVDGTLYRIETPELKAVNTVGCGDSFTAGMAFGLERCYSVEETLRLAAAAGSANALTEEAGNVRKEDLDHLLSQIRISKSE